MSLFHNEIDMMRRMSFARLLVVTAFAAGLALPFSAQAGFEFMPQKAQPKPAPAPTLPTQIAPPMMPSMALQAGMVPAVPMAPVTRAPLRPIAAPVQPSAQMMPATRSSNLVINPYPMQPGYQRSAMANVASGSVNRAMVEQAGIVTPMPLGTNMQTGAQVALAPRSIKKTQQQAAYSAPSNLTPIPGGNPAPVARAPLGQNNIYAQAVGFGKEIPLSIALMQVVPDGFNAQLSNSDLENAIVSWEGGKPWNQVLNDMLRPLGYSASIQGSNVSIGPYLRG